jgi:prephenate dehydratase
MQDIKNSYAIQGSLGSFNHIALLSYLKAEGVTGFDTVESGSVSQVFEDLRLGKARFGQFAVFNNLAGFVHETLGCVGSEQFKIVDTYSLEIHHCLLTKNRDLSQVKYVYSHPHALAQCSEFLQRNNLQPIEWIDTAKSAKDLATGRIDQEISAVIAPKICSELYGLNLVAENIENSFSRTEFWLVEREQ